MKAIQVKRCGSPEVLELVGIQKPSPGPKQALVKIEAAGVNYIDIYFRTCLYKADLPFTPGMEAAGGVAAGGSGAPGGGEGGGGAYALARGWYAEYARVRSWQFVKIPEPVESKTAAAAMLQGMTAHYLTHSTYPLKKGETALLHAAAGGAGLLIVQMAKMLGARVIGTVS